MPNSVTGEPTDLELPVERGCPFAVPPYERPPGSRRGLILIRRALGRADRGRTGQGVSQRMLTVTTKRLCRDDLIERTVYPTLPPQTDYRLTDMGRSR
ncbi:winged helix-turn-helix transcriptional regulator [Nonomuraea cavernae]|uniref:winged helix-turn-helix transcriptional regulator n=1 Tax=Nonomuraea cavernae TaxID=2045107 RepID=UPI00341195BA